MLLDHSAESAGEERGRRPEMLRPHLLDVPVAQSPPIIRLSGQRDYVQGDGIWFVVHALVKAVRGVGRDEVAPPDESRDSIEGMALDPTRHLFPVSNTSMMREEPETRWYGFWMDIMPAPTTPLLTGAAADRQLDHIVGAQRSRHEVFLPTLRAAHNGFGVPGRMAPPSARGLRAWLDGTEELRLRLTRFGWTVPTDAALDSAGVVLSPDGTVGIAMVAGDGSTGRTGQPPQVKYSRGPVASEFVQGDVFKGFVVDSEEGVEMFYLLHEVKIDGWHAELAAPAELKSGRVLRWKQRVQIAVDGPGGGEPLPSERAPDLPTPTVRWRESA